MARLSDAPTTRLEGRPRLVVDIGDASLPLHSRDILLRISHCLVCLSTHSDYSSFRGLQFPTKGAVRILVQLEFANCHSSGRRKSAARCSPNQPSLPWVYRNTSTSRAALRSPAMPRRHTDTDLSASVAVMPTTGADKSAEGN